MRSRCAMHDQNESVLMGILGRYSRLDELGVAHSGIDDQHYGSGVSFRDPDGIALEFFAPPG